MESNQTQSNNFKRKRTYFTFKLLIRVWGKALSSVTFKLIVKPKLVDLKHFWDSIENS